MIENIKTKLAELTDFAVKAEFYQASTTSARIIFIEPHESSAEIKSGLNPAYAETSYIRVVIGVPTKSSPNAPQDLVDAVRQVRSKIWSGERMGDRVSWLPCVTFKEFETCKFMAPNANETKALAVLTFEIKSMVSI
jgi:hypothetical protein